jgi:hypothetical protein
VRAGDVEFGAQGGRVTDREQVWVLGFEIPCHFVAPADG